MCSIRSSFALIDFRRSFILFSFVMLLCLGSSSFSVACWLMGDTEGDMSVPTFCQGRNHRLDCVATLHRTHSTVLDKLLKLSAESGPPDQ